MKPILKSINTYILLMIAALALSFAGCGSSSVSDAGENQEAYLLKGDSIATMAQKILLSNVSNAMASGGSVGAVEFCNENAIPLTDSVSDLHAVHIQRLSDKVRNPNNAITSEMDQKAWDDLKMMLSDETISDKHLIVKEGQSMFYYKPIMLGMSSCLVCHGSTELDIASTTYETILSKYSDDKAIDYKMGDFRGMWKIKMDL